MDFLLETRSRRAQAIRNFIVQRSVLCPAITVLVHVLLHLPLRTCFTLLVMVHSSDALEASDERITKRDRKMFYFW